MHRLVALLVVLASTGCIDVDGDGDVEGASLAPAAGACQRSYSTPIWSSGSGDVPADVTFDVPRGVATLELEWTTPMYSARAWSATVTDARGDEVFVREQGEGASVGRTSISMGGSRSTESVQQPPVPGEYRFRFEADGEVQGAALGMTMTGCW